jgi:uncharacterized protein
MTNIDLTQLLGHCEGREPRGNLVFPACPFACITIMPLLYLLIMKINEHPDIYALKSVLEVFRKQGKILLAYLYGSYAKNEKHLRSDIDLAVFIKAGDEKEAIGIIDSLLMAAEADVEILRLDDEDESPFIIQESLKGIPLVEPDMETLYRVAHRALHEAESIRYRRMSALSQS